MPGQYGFNTGLEKSTGINTGLEKSTGINTEKFECVPGQYGIEKKFSLRFSWNRVQTITSDASRTCREYGGVFFFISGENLKIQAKKALFLTKFELLSVLKPY